MKRAGFVIGVAAVSICAAEGRAGTVSGTSPAAFQQEALVSGSIASGGSFTTRILFDGTNESRGVYEFALPTLPAGGTYTSATLNYTVAETNSTNPPLRASRLRFFGYGGDGRYQTTDASAGTSFGLSAEFFTPGAQSTALDTSVVNTVAGSSWLGVMAWQENTNYRTGVARGGAGGPAPTLTYTAQVPDVGTLSTRAAVDALADGGSGSFVVTDGGLSINAQELGNTNRRGILEFNLGGLPDGAVLTSASLSFDTNAYTADSVDGGPEPRFYGYAGDGTASPADALQTSSLLAVGWEVTDLNTYDVALNPATVQALLAGGNYLGILVRGSADGNQFGFDANETLTFGGAPATLNVTYAVPEPASLAGLVLGGIALLARRRADRLRGVIASTVLRARR